MTLQVSALEAGDLEEFVQVDDLAMKDYGVAQAMSAQLPQGQTRKDLIMGFMREAMARPDPSKMWLKVTDTALGTDKIIAGGCWEFHPGRRSYELPAGPGPAGTDLFRTMQRHQAEFRDRHVGLDPYAHLAVVFTHPAHRRQGAASLLVRYGCEMADRDRLPCTLTASRQGLGVYLKHGFVVVEEDEMDLSPWGVNEMELRRGMVRPKR